MLSNVMGIQQCDLARSTRTAYGSKHFPLTRKKFALYALKIYQLFHSTLSDESMKLKYKTESLGAIFMNKFIKISHAWRKQ